jgi:hypothetical protein
MSGRLGLSADSGARSHRALVVRLAIRFCGRMRFDHPFDHPDDPSGSF